jgi:hypothetical protein
MSNHSGLSGGSVGARARVAAATAGAMPNVVTWIIAAEAAATRAAKTARQAAAIAQAAAAAAEALRAEMQPPPATNRGH